MHTHMYGGTRPILDDDYRLLPFLKEARRRGVKFDMGHGGNSFWWNQAAPAIREGWVPDTISTDIHVQSMNAGMKDMITTMSKILSLGVPLFDVIKMSTLNPATQMKHPELGCLSPGAGADVAVLRLEKGRFGYLDVHNARFMGAQKLVCELTLRDGKVVWDLNGLAGEDWEKYYANPEHSKPPSHPPRTGASPASR
jgi:dihydroorotase